MGAESASKVGRVGIQGIFYTEIGKKACLFAKLQPGRAEKRINAT